MFLQHLFAQYITHIGETEKDFSRYIYASHRRRQGFTESHRHDNGFHRLCGRTCLYLCLYYLYIIIYIIDACVQVGKKGSRLSYGLSTRNSNTSLLTWGSNFCYFVYPVYSCKHVTLKVLLHLYVRSTLLCVIGLENFDWVSRNFHFIINTHYVK